MHAGFSFCDKHRYAENHECDFDHKERGRSDIARSLPKADKSVGLGVHRMDSANEHA